jgi:hypothetical protein
VNPPLLSLAAAADYLGCRPRTLRKLLDRSRLKMRGIPVAGPTIRFFQARNRGAIRFRRAWLDEYIEAGTHTPPEAESPAVVQWPTMKHNYIDMSLADF